MSESQHVRMTLMSNDLYVKHHPANPCVPAVLHGLMEAQAELSNLLNAQPTLTKRLVPVVDAVNTTLAVMIALAERMGMDVDDDRKQWARAQYTMRGCTIPGVHTMTMTGAELAAYVAAAAERQGVPVPAVKPDDVKDSLDRMFG